MVRNVWTEKAAGQGFTLDIDIDPGLLTAKDIMHYGIVHVGRREPVARAADLLVERGISGLPVLHEGKIVGMLSDKDLLKVLYESEYLPGLVEEYMTPTCYCFDVEDAVADICKYLNERPFRRVPILHKQRVAGMITRGDIINVYKDKFRPADEPPAHPFQHELLAENIMRSSLPTVYPSTSLYAAMTQVVTKHITGLPVVNSDMNLLGIITEKDFLHVISAPHRPETVVADAMTCDVTTLDHRANIKEICQCLIDTELHTIPILENDRLVGVISRADVLKSRLSVFQP